MLLRSWVVVAVAMWGLVSDASVARGQGPARVGEKVVTRHGVPLRVGRRVVDDGARFRVYKVERASGDWLWLVAPDARGWVRSGQVVPFDRAIEFYTDRIRSAPGSPADYVDRGLVWRERGDPQKAIADYDQAIRLDPSDAATFLSRGIAWADLRDDDKALADFDEAICLAPKSPVAFHYRAIIRMGKGQYEGAIRDYTEAILLSPTSAEALDGRALAWRALGSYDKAIADYDEALRLDPGYTTAYYGRGATRLARCECDRAVTDLSEAIRRDPHWFGMYFSRGEAWMAKGEFDRAIADLNEAIRLHPIASFPLHWPGGASPTTSGGELSAIGEPAVSVVYLQRAIAWHFKMEFDKAIADYTEALRLDPAQVPAFNERGNARAAKGQYGEALADFDAALRLDSECADALGRRAWIWATCPDPGHRDGGRAIASATRACVLTEWKAPAHLHTLAAAYAEAGDFDKAVDYQEKANTLCTDILGRHRGQERLALYRDKRPFRDVALSQ